MNDRMKEGSNEWMNECNWIFVNQFCSFQVGDLVLIILDERHDNYVLFTVGPTLYFLHSESLNALDLKPGLCVFLSLYLCLKHTHRHTHV